MIPLPPGCTVLYSIWIDIDELSNDILDWYGQIGGSKKTDTYYDHRSREKADTYVSYGKGKIVSPLSQWRRWHKVAFFRKRC